MPRTLSSVSYNFIRCMQVWAVFGEGSFRADSAKLEPSLWDTLLVTFSRCA